MPSRFKRALHMAVIKVLNEYFWREYLEIKKIESYDDLINFQNNYLTRLLLHAYHNVPYYSKILREYDVTDGKTVNLENFTKIPPLTKDDIRNNFNLLLSKDYTSRDWYYNSSGGSTGEPVRFVQDKEYKRWAKATNYYYYYDILGVDEISSKKALIWGSEKEILELTGSFQGKIINWLTNSIMLNAFKMTEKDLHQFVTTINKFKPDIIRAYATALYELARFVEKKRLSIHSPKIIVSTAEMLTDFMREKIESVFGTKVFNFYGSRESSAIAGECLHQEMHIFSFNQYVEVVNFNDPSIKQINSVGKILITTLHNYSMPLIRYEIGDTGILSSEKGICGHYLPVLKKITGRITDNFIRKDGTIIHGEYFTHLFYFKDWVKKFQVVQEDFDKIRILIVPKGVPIEKEKNEIEKGIKKVMGPECRIIWDIVDDIPVPPSGKHIFTKSLLYER
ncbi:MAG: phenylacetate--CoA ligase family protein [Candidatus Asgardarchaeia archaeon]